MNEDKTRDATGGEEEKRALNEVCKTDAMIWIMSGHKT